MIHISFKTLSVGALLPALAAILVLSAPSPHAEAQILYVGDGSSDQTTSFTSGTTTYTGAFIGNTSTDSNNTLNVLNPGTRLTINGGNVQVGFAGSGNSMVISNGGFVSDVTGVVSFGTTGSNNSALVTGTGSTWSNSNQVRLAVSGSGTLTVANGGSVIASGVNGIQVAVNAGSMGVLNIGSYGGTDSAGSIVAPKIGFNSGTGYLNFNQTGTFTLTNAITGANTIFFQQLGSGTTILTGANSSANRTLISNGTLQIGDGGANGSIGSRAIINNSVLAINSSTNVTFGSGNGITGTGVLVQMGTGTTTLTGSNTTYSGGTLISDGTLRVGAGPTGSFGDTNGSLGTGNVTNNATLLFSRRGAIDTVSNNISGTGTLTMFGSTGGLTLAGSNSYSGPTTIDSSYTLQIGTGSTNGTLGTGSVSNAGTLSFNRSDLYTAANTISGTGAVRQIGSGTTILLGSSSYSGATTVTNGILQIGNGGTSGSVGGGGITLSGSGNLAFNRADSVTIANSIGGGGGTLSQIGSGTLILTGGGASYGGTVISNGTLQIGDGGANGSIGAGAITNNSVLAINSSTNITFANNQAITGTGVLIQMGTGTTILNSANTTYSGGTLISAGSLHVGTGINFDSNGSLGTGDVTNNGTLAFNRGLSGDIVSNNISGTGRLDVLGSGNTTTLTGSNSFSGLTTITAPNTLQVGSGSTNGTLGTGSVSNAGTLSFNRSDLYTAANTISGTGAVRQIGSGTTILSGSNSYTGATTISSGALQIGNGGTTGSIAGNVVNNATLIFNRSDASTYSGIINGPGAVTKQGGGTLTLAGANSYSGGTTISDGVLALGGANAVGASGTIRFGGGTLQYSASNTTDYSSRFSTAASQAYSIDTNGQNVTWASPLASSGGTLTKSGTGALTLAGANSYSGVTTISGGTLALSGAGSIGTGGLNLGSGGVFDLTALTSGTYSLPSTGDLIGSGTLTGNGRALAVLGAFQPGNSPGTVTADTGFTLDLSGATSTTFDITDPLFTAGTYDLVNGNGSMIFGGILNLAFSGGSYADGADMLQLFSNTGGFSGDFTSVVSTGLAAGQAATFNAATGFISITAVPEPSTYAMALAGLACGGWQMMRRRRLR